MTDKQTLIDRFQADMAAEGVRTNDKLIADGALHRAHADSDKPGSLNISYIIHPDPPQSYYYEYFPFGIKKTGTLSGEHRALSALDRVQIEDERKKRQMERKVRQRKAADKARYVWHKAEPVSASTDHVYLVCKAIKPYQIRISRNALLIPIYNESRELVNLQFIYPDGTKRFLRGGRKKGCFSIIGDSTGNDRLLICEGYATGASLHEELGLFVMIALDAGNLEPVAQAARRLFPAAEIVIAGDNDLPDQKGVCRGQTEARKAALAVGGKYLIPDQAGTDWNDVLTARVA